MTIQAGDVVQLKSGGPKMTVEWVEEPRGAYCVWFVGNKQESSLFLPAVLEPAKDNNSGSIKVIRS